MLIDASNRLGQESGFADGATWAEYLPDENKVNIAIIDGDSDFLSFYRDFWYSFCEYGFLDFTGAIDAIWFDYVGTDIRQWNYWFSPADDISYSNEGEMYMRFITGSELKDGSNLAGPKSDISCLADQKFKMLLVDGAGLQWEINFCFTLG